MRYWKTPAGQRSVLYSEMLKQPHVLIAGATGSGKSVVINGIMHAALFDSPAKRQFILIDLKRVELIDFKSMPHTIAYADDITSAVKALENALGLIERRFQDMQRRREKLYNGSDVYVVIDEMADLMTVDAKHVAPLIQRICQIGRAARVHVIAATQCPIAKVIPTQIKCNFDARLGLRTRSMQDSRNILEATGCEQLPRFGKGYYMQPQSIELCDLPMIQPDEMKSVLDHWKHNRKPHFKFGRL